MDTLKEIEFFSKKVSIDGQYDPLSRVANARLIASFQQLIKPLPGETCIEMGCGTGAFSKRLLELGLSLHGIDICPPAIEVAKKEVRQATFSVGDVRSTHFPDSSVDVLVYSGVLHHFCAYEDRMSALKEGLRILKPGGRLFSYDPNAASPAMWLYRSPKSPLSRLFVGIGQTEDEILIGSKQIVSELTNSGFSIAMTRGIGGITIQSTSNLLGRVVMPFYNLYERLMTLPIFEKKFGTLLITYAEKPKQIKQGRT